MSVAGRYSCALRAAISTALTAIRRTRSGGTRPVWWRCLRARMSCTANPLSIETVAALVAQVAGDVPHHSLSVTGGEPLLHVPFIRALKERVPLPIFLETNGTLHDALARCIDCVSYISMDIKLPGVLSHPVWDAHARFLEIARTKDVYVKVVVAAETREDEVRTAARMVAETAPDVLLILQPVTPYGGCTAPTPARLLALQQIALVHVPDVRVIPQTHRMMDLL